jgi:hypothetical protein
MKRQALRGRYGSRELGAEPARIVRISDLIRPRWHPVAFVARLPDASFGKPCNAAGDRRHGERAKLHPSPTAKSGVPSFGLKGTFNFCPFAEGSSFVARSPAHFASGTPRHPKALLVPLCSACGSALTASCLYHPKGTRHGQSRSLSAENLHRRIRGPRRYTAGQTANRCTPRFVTTSFPDALPLKPSVCVTSIREKLNALAFSRPVGLQVGSRKLDAYWKKPEAASFVRSLGKWLFRREYPSHSDARTGKAISHLLGFRIYAAPLPSPSARDTPDTGNPVPCRWASSLRAVICRRLLPSVLPLRPPFA